jgi:hypothetical protein
MKRLSLITILIIATVSGNWRTVSPQENSGDWITVQACRVSLQLPQNLKRTGYRGIDSCVAQFQDGETSLLLDYGTWGGATKKTDSTLEFAEESLVVDGKTGVLATYVMYPGNQRQRKYLAHLYVALEPAKGPHGRPVSLMLTLIGRNTADVDLARRIFQSVRFSVERRTNR